MRFRSVMIRLHPEVFDRLASVAGREERTIDQQATYFVRRCMSETELPREVAAKEVANAVSDR